MIAVFADSMLYVNTRRVHVVHRVLPAGRVPRRGDLLGGARPRRIGQDEVQPH